ncbi:hypothetical protein AGRHK599_LOCUS3546 [Rhizobium rhizogenes]|uniref:Uncharacterized protein n=1 Tax=Rhizobium rhizogenes TaxID=359 RepID=A0AAN2DEP8_RHIRH|nr:hypothetical protein AGRHK599_LOCUS3546 [Rhizobium rhizogenes]
MSSSLRDASFIISVCHTRPKTFKRIAGPSRHVFRRLPRIVPDIVSSIGRCSMKTPFLGKGQTYRRISTRPSEIATNLRSAIIRACVFTADKQENGVHERIRTSDPRIHTTSALTAVRSPMDRTFVVWTVPSPWALRPLGAAHPVSTPSPDFSGAWLGIGMLEDQRSFPRL